MVASLLTMGFDTNVYVEAHMLNGTPQAVKQNHLKLDGFVWDERFLVRVPIAC